jgi:hypothetical protein
MKLSVIPFTIMALFLANIIMTTDAFVVAPLSLQRAVSSFTQVKIQMSSTDDEPTVDTTPMEPGSHDELMYAMGVNLARQLGDVRPLVESGDELASVAKGLLDTVIGRLSEDGQRNLLARRGQDLNHLITARS